MRMRCLIVAVLALAPIEAVAAPVRLAFEGTCSGDAVEHRLRELTSDAPEHDAAPLVSVKVSLADHGVTATVLSIDRDGTERGPRTLEATTCDELEAALAVVIAALARAPEVDVEPVPATVVVVAPTETSAIVGTPRNDASTGSRALAMVLGASGTASVNGLHSEALIGVAMRRRGHSLGVAVRGRLPEQLDVAAGAGHVRISALAVEVAPCAHVRRYAACGTLGLGWIATSAAGLLDQSPARLPTAQLGARLVVEQPISTRFALRARVDARAGLARARVLVDEMPVWVSPAAEASAGIDIVAQFP